MLNLKSLTILAYPTDKASSNQKIIYYVKAQRKRKYRYKSSTRNADNADCEAIINFTNREIKEK